jgi:ketosteroid isomerase-like protein
VHGADGRPTGLGGDRARDAHARCALVGVGVFRVADERHRARGRLVVWDGHGVANDGEAYANSYAWIMRLVDGKVVDGTAFYDSISFNDLWTRVQP